MRFGRLMCFWQSLRPHSLCRCATVNAPANRQMPIASVVSGHCNGRHNIEIIMNEIEAYIKQFPDTVQEILQNIRKLINDNAPNADELFAYGMPAYKLNKKPLVYFAAFKNHIGFYATPSGHSEFQDELSKYKQGKGSVQFPLDKPIPYKLIERIVKFSVIENNKKANAKTILTKQTDN